ncbi:ATP-binding protein [Paraflavitalea soli]|nr:ATP-binding protein [Paraflavitalea soli]
MAPAPPQNKSTIAVAGEHIQNIQVKFSPQFMSLLSEHLYSSPNKAFEELVTNSWDAEASRVYVSLPDSPSHTNASIAILDNGNSMDIDGFQQLWTVAESDKRTSHTKSGRKKIGKFGVGKLSTYVLCNELTYICKAADGVIRIVTMDYRQIDEATDKHLDKLPLSVRHIPNESALESILESYAGGKAAFQLIKDGIPKINVRNDSVNEFGGADPILQQNSDTWTLAILTSLKPKGQAIKKGWVRYMLSTALPLGASLAIQVNEEPVESSKYETPISQSWQIGSKLPFDTISGTNGNALSITRNEKPYPHIQVPGLGEVTGTITLFKENLSGRKSDHMGVSHGFFVNVLGRVVNYEDNQFKLPNLNHGVFARLRVAIRVDELDEHISVNRETLAEGNKVKLVRNLLHEIFNMARREESNQQDATFKALAQTRKDNLEGLPLTPLANVISKSFTEASIPPSIIDLEVRPDTGNLINEWLKNTKYGTIDTLGNIEFQEKDPKDLLSKYDVKERKIIINKNHPFAVANSTTKEQNQLLQDILTAQLIADSYLLSSGLPMEACNDYFMHRDRSQRLIAQIRRNSAPSIIHALDEWKDQAKPFEEIVGDALEYLGLQVTRMGQKGQPEGVATAYLSPIADQQNFTYKLTYDTKATKHNAVQTGNVHAAGLSRHKRDHNANYTLVVAPAFQEGALEKEMENNQITPMTARTLAKLLSICIGFGPINLNQLQELFKLYDPGKVDKWVNDLGAEMEQRSQVNLPLLAKTLTQLMTPETPDVFTCSTIAQKYRDLSGQKGHPSALQIKHVFQGLNMLIPSIVSTDPNSDRIFIFNTPERMIDEIRRHTNIIPESLKLGAIKE